MQALKPLLLYWKTEEGKEKYSSLVIQKILQEKPVVDGQKQSGEILYKFIEKEGINSIEHTTISVNDVDDIEDVDDIKQTIDINIGQYFAILNIPSLGLKLPVNENWSYGLLKETPCRYLGSIKEKNLIIIAHDNGKHFGSINKLKNGDVVILEDKTTWDKINYRVSDVIEINATEENAIESSKGYSLSLMTCISCIDITCISCVDRTRVSCTEKRYLVRCKN